MIKRLCLAIFLLISALSSSALPSQREAPLRILSITPAGTEILYDLGLGDRVVGVTNYCSWPPEARSKPKIGDMMYTNMEVVISLRPDLVLVSNMNEHLKSSIEAIGCQVVVVYQDNFEQICDSMIRVGEVCGVADAARKRVDELKASALDISARGKAGPSKRVLIVVGRDMEDKSFKKIYVAGRRSFYNDLLVESGTENAFFPDVQYAQISREGLLRLDPDIVVELIGENGMENLPSPEIMAQWDAMKELRASKEGRVAIIRGDFTLRAGPRYPLVLEALRKIIRERARVISE